MLKNISFLALAGSLVFASAMTGCLVTVNDDSGTSLSGDGDGDASTSDTTGDGDGDPTTGDGDGDPATGDGDGDGDPTTGDGDGDPTTGDGDGDPTTGDGDGDPAGMCGWDPAGDPPGYYCGGEGEDPDMMIPMACPDGLVDGEACGDVTGAGCCDADGNNWYCGDDGMGNQFLVLAACG